MSGSEKTITVGIVAVSLSFIAAVAGCTTVNMPENRAPLLKACVDAGLEWHDGFCIRQKQEGGKP